MRMTHIYQPIMIRTLLELNNTATVEDIAREFLNSDPSQMPYYKKVTKRWPHRTLKFHNVVSYQKGKYTLLLDNATNLEKKKIIEMCDLRLQQYIDSDPQIRLARAINSGPIPGTLAYDVLAKSKGRCLACGITASDAQLHVDHILPRSCHGKTELANLQALCRTCNTAKRNRDDTDFIKWQNRLKYRHSKCQLCDPAEQIMENSMACAVHNRNQEPHLVVPKRHVGSFTDLIPAERHLCLELVDSVKAAMKKDDRSVNGFDVHFDPESYICTPIVHSCISIAPRQ